jgi:hypothetical protein
MKQPLAVKLPQNPLKAGLFYAAAGKSIMGKGENRSLACGNPPAVW